MNRASPAGQSLPPGPAARAVVAVEIRPASPAGPPGVRVRAESGAWATLHDAPDRIAEAHAQLAGVSMHSPAVLVVVGGGLGYLTEAACARWPDTVVVVIEPLAVLADAARARTPALYASGRVRLLAGPEYQGAEELWRVFDTPGFTGAPPPIVAHPVLSRAWPALMSEAARVVGRAMMGARMNAQARAENAGRYVVNTLRNVGHIVDGANPERLRRQFAGVPAVVVGAGPSLDHNVHALAAMHGRALVIATDTAWRPLVRAGVSPHLVVALDPTPANGRHLQGLESSRETWIIAEGSVDPDALREHRGRVSTFRVAAHHPWPWLHALGVDRLVLRAWGSVLTSAYDLALVCGCDPVVFVGADLAFTDGRPYCRGTSMEDEWAQHTARGVSVRSVWRNTLAARPLLTERDVTGAEVLTAPHLVEFRNWLTARAGEARTARIVNATGAGILHGPGVQQARLEDVLAPLIDCDDDLRATVRAALHGHGASATRARVRDAVRELGDVATASAPVTDWVAFGRPTLRPTDIAAAAVDARTALTVDVCRSAVAVVPAPLRWHAADRVASMRARLTGTSAGLDGGSPPGARPRDEAEADAVRLIETLLETPVLATSIGPDVAAGAVPETVPLTSRFVWTADAAPLVAALEEALLEGAASAERHPHPSCDDYWNEPIVPVAVAVERAAMALDATDAAARSALLAERLAVCGGGLAADSDARLRVSRMFAAAARAMTDPALASLTASSLDLPVAGARVRLPILIDALMRAVTGTIAEPVASGDPRSAFLTAEMAHVEPTSLTSRGLPRGWGLSTAGNDRAIFVAGQARHSIRLTPEGDVTAGVTWPGPITHEVPWGSRGGALAWNAVDHTVFWRAHLGAEAEQTRAPFKPMHLALAPDGVAYWTDASANVWEWTPGRESVLVGSLPASGIPRFEGAELIVAPMPRDEQGRAVRRRVPYEWRIDRISGGCHVIETGVEGQCAKVARRGAVVARSYPGADLIRLEAPGASPVWLACYAPLDVGWAGDSLVVVSGGSAVLIFTRLLECVTALESGPQLAVETSALRA